MANTNQLKQQESGAVNSQTSSKGFNPVTSNSEVTAVSDGRQSSRKGYFAGYKNVGTRSQDRKDDGVHILTIEERYESELPEGAVRPLPYSTGKGPRTPGESGKTSEDGSLENFGVTQESLPMGPLSTEPAASASSPPATAKHPYGRY